MTTDFDASRVEITDVDGEALPGLIARRAEPSELELDVDDAEAAETFELPGADLSGEELSVRVVPIQRDEFTCGSCFLVQHRSRVARADNNMMICRDSAG